MRSPNFIASSLHRSGRGSQLHELAEEIVLLDRSQAGVGVAAGSKAELERIGAELLLELEAVLQRLAGIFVLDACPVALGRD